MIPDERVIKSYVWHDGECFFVSTINRDSSSMIGGRYAETMVWGYDWDNRKRGGLVGQGEASEGSIYGHQQICKLLFDTGKCEPEDDDE